MKQRITLFVLALAVTLTTGAFAGDVYSEVVAMLEADLSEEVILDWISGLDELPGHPTSEQLIALKRSGASDELLQELMAVSRVQPERSTPPAGPAPEPEPIRAPQSQPTSSVPLGEAPTEDPLVTFKLSYEAPKVDFDEELWDLYVYLDGKPLAYVPPTFSPFDRETGLEFTQRLAPGRHVLRVAQERHEKRLGGKWRHSARVATQEFIFELSPGEPAKVELTYREGWLATRSNGPLRFRSTQADQVAELEWVGGSPEGWPLLCEELDSEQRRTADCIRWQELWGDTAAPSRGEVRQALEMFDYRPVPRGS